MVHISVFSRESLEKSKTLAVHAKVLMTLAVDIFVIRQVESNSELCLLS